MARRLLTLLKFMVPRRASGATTLIILTPALLTVTTGQDGLTAASSSVLGRGTATAGDMAGAAAAGDVADTATDVVGMQVAAVMQDTDTLVECAVELEPSGAAHR